jgi:hypothetical protein
MLRQLPVPISHSLITERLMSLCLVLVCGASEKLDMFEANAETGLLLKFATSFSSPTGMHVS